MRRPSIAVVALAASALLACAEPKLSAPTEVGQVPDPAASQQLPIELCAFGQAFTLNVRNPYAPLAVGSVWEYSGVEDGALVELRITVLKKTERVGGVETRVVEEVEWEDGELVEKSWNFFAETAAGTLCYFGEDVDIYEDGKVVSHEGAWRADAAGNVPGIFMPAAPRPGTSFQMEGAPGIAVDLGEVLGSGPVVVPAGSFSDVIRIRETNPLDGSSGIKHFGRDVGLLVDGPVALVSFSPGGDKKNK